MTVVNPSQSNAGDTIEASDINNPVNQIAAVVNGNIDATNIAASAIGTTQLANLSVTYGKLLATIFSGQLTTAANAGTAGGNLNYINLGGIKLLWGSTNTFAVAAGAAPQSSSTAIITYPASFFTTVTCVQVMTTTVATTAGLYFSVTGSTAANLSIQLQETAGSGGSSGAYYFVIGT